MVNANVLLLLLIGMEIPVSLALPTGMQTLKLVSFVLALNRNGIRVLKLVLLVLLDNSGILTLVCVYLIRIARTEYLTD